MVRRRVIRVRDLRFFNGYCAWEVTQIRKEIWAGLWTTRIIGCFSYCFHSRVRTLGSVVERRQASVCLSSATEHVKKLLAGNSSSMTDFYLNCEVELVHTNFYPETLDWVAMHHLYANVLRRQIFLQAHK